VAQKLHDTYGFSYDNLKVLLGGWNTWLQENAKDPNAYPTDSSTGGAAPNTSGDTGNPVQLVTTDTNPVAPVAPAPTK
jgi:hypothetical protein